MAVVVGVGFAYNGSLRPRDNYVSSYTPASKTPVDSAPLVAVIGDSYTGGSAMGGYGAGNWTEIIRLRLNSANMPVRMTMSGQGGSGYVNPGSRGTVFPGEAARIVDPYDKVVVIFGSRNDTRQPVQAVRSAANATYSQIKSTAANATLVVIGPAWTNRDVPPAITAIRDVLRSEAEAAGAVFVDPLTESWFFGEETTLIGEDGVNPTDDGHQYLADRIEPYIRAALTA